MSWLMVYAMLKNELSKIGGHIPSAPVQSDYNQNNAESPDYIKNRPFSSYFQYGTLLDEITITTSYTYKYFDEKFPLIEGKKYTVTFDGIAYDVVCKYGRTGYYLGDIVDNDYSYTSYPFVIEKYDNGTVCLNVKDDGTYTVKIETDLEYITPLDDKFLSETAGRIYRLPRELTAADLDKAALYLQKKIVDFVVIDGIYIYQISKSYINNDNYNIYIISGLFSLSVTISPDNNGLYVLGLSSLHQESPEQGRNGALAVLHTQGLRVQYPGDKYVVYPNCLEIGNNFYVKWDGEIGCKSLFLNSSDPNSKRQFLVTIDDNGNFSSKLYNLITAAESIDSSDTYNNGSGYKYKYELTGTAPFEASTTKYTSVTGYIPYTVNESGFAKPIYIKGCNWDTTSNSKLYTFQSDKNSLAELQISGDSMGEWTAEKIADKYYKLSPPENCVIASVAYIRLQLNTNASGVVVSYDPI